MQLVSLYPLLLAMETGHALVWHQSLFMQSKIELGRATQTELGQRNLSIARKVGSSGATFYLFLTGEFSWSHPIFSIFVKNQARAKLDLIFQKCN